MLKRRINAFVGGDVLTEGSLSTYTGCISQPKRGKKETISDSTYAYIRAMAGLIYGQNGGRDSRPSTAELELAGFDRAAPAKRTEEPSGEEEKTFKGFTKL